MMQRIQILNRGQRVILFFLMFGGGLFLLAALTLFLYTFTLNSQPRVTARAVVADITLREYAQLEGDEAYPAALAVAPDGTLYTGSYQTGAIYEIDPDGTTRILADSREFIGSVTGLALAPDGALFITDRVFSNPESAGGQLWRLQPGQTPEEYAIINDETGFVTPERVAVAPDGAVFVTDAGRGEVWQFGDDDFNRLFWTVPDDVGDSFITAIVYDPANEALLVADAVNDVIYRIDRQTGEHEVIFRYEGEPGARRAGIYGLALSDDPDTYYIAGLDIGVAEIHNGALTVLATDFRGPRDVAYHEGQLYVANIDSRALFTPGLEPQLPFALDVINLGERTPGGPASDPE